jgi:glycosyltransferase involved in cell wall biosynthesis
MGARLPVVATRVSGALEVIENGVNGRLVAPGSAGELTAAILELYRDPEARARMGEKARETVAAHYSQEAMLSRLGALYLEILGAKAPGGVARVSGHSD